MEKISTRNKLESKLKKALQTGAIFLALNTTGLDGKAINSPTSQDKKLTTTEQTVDSKVNKNQSQKFILGQDILESLENNDTIETKLLNDFIKYYCKNCLIKDLKISKLKLDSSTYKIDTKDNIYYFVPSKQLSLSSNGFIKNRLLDNLFMDYITSKEQIIIKQKNNTDYVLEKNSKELDKTEGIRILKIDNILLKFKNNTNYYYIEQFSNEFGLKKSDDINQTIKYLNIFLDKLSFSDLLDLDSMLNIYTDKNILYMVQELLLTKYSKKELVDLLNKN